MVSAAQNSLINASISPLQLGSDISAAIGAKTQQATKQEGADVLELLDSAMQGLTPGDPLVAKATGLGGNLDITA